MASMIQSPILDTLMPKLKEAAQLIKESIKDKRPVLIRHHADCDGYSGGIALERSILSHMGDAHRRESDAYFYYRRLPSKTPFYDMADATKDVSNFLSDQARFERKAPLIIVVDNGSCAEDLMAIKMLKLYGADIMVIDHHPPFDENDKYISVHINPLLVGGSGGLTAGMICAELAYIISPKARNIDLLAGLAGVSDRSDLPELPQYIELCEKKGYGSEKLLKVAEALEFELTFIGYLESRQLVDDLFFGDLKTLEEFIALVDKDIKIKRDRQMVSIIHFMKLSEQKDKVVVMLDLSTSIRMGYPAAGKTTGMMFDYISTLHKKPVVALGYADDFITIRMTRGLKYSVQEIISILSEKLAFAQIDGGGHATAGTIRFVSAVREEILKLLKEYLK
jgi:archaea-specific RecJ-like exonuclease